MNLCEVKLISNIDCIGFYEKNHDSSIKILVPNNR